MPCPAVRPSLGAARAALAAGLACFGLVVWFGAAAAPTVITVVTEDNRSGLLNPRDTVSASPGAEIACTTVRRAGFECSIARRESVTQQG